MQIWPLSNAILLIGQAAQLEGCAEDSWIDHSRLEILQRRAQNSFSSLLQGSVNMCEPQTFTREKERESRTAALEAARR